MGNPSLTSLSLARKARWVPMSSSTNDDAAPINHS